MSSSSLSGRMWDIYNEVASLEDRNKELEAHIEALEAEIDRLEEDPK